MSTLTATQQSDRQAWNEATYGKFSASNMGKLMTEPKGKEDKAAGKFGATAITLIKQKAVERVLGRRMHTAANFSMKRGTLLEHAACYLLSQYWQECYGCTWMPYGSNSGATPDFLLRDNSPGDIKCPEDEGQLFEYAQEVTDWNSLLKWNKDYAWQIATQALAAGSTKATLVYFTDKVPAIRITEEQYLTANVTMEAMGHALLRMTGQIYDYAFNFNDGEPGFMFVAKTMDIPSEAFDQINAVLERAEVECDKYVREYRSIYNQAPTPEQVEAQLPSAA